MKKSYYLLVLFLFTKGFCQKNTNDLNSDYERVYIEVGIISPLGNLKNKFESSPSFGFWFRNRIIKDDYVDFGFNFFIPKNPRNLIVSINDTVLSYKSDHFAINIGARFARVMPLSMQSDNTTIEWNSGIGAGLNFYDAPDEFTFKEGKNKQEVLATFLISQGIKLNYKNVGFQIHYQFSPYRLFMKNHEPNFGSQSLLFGFVYRQ